MAVTTSSSATIRGITYSKGSSFKCYASYAGNGGSEGNASAASALTKGTTYYFYCKASGDNVKYPYAVSTTSGGAVKGWYTENVFPYATYSVKYNANGGTGAPATDTKIYGTTLKLDTATPTRTGYTFQGWGTSASDTSVDYAAGASYTKNAAITLYAIWKANTYTISFNANGGSGAPSSVTKTYGVDLTLPTTVPTRTNYEFLGWSTDKDASTATYSAGGKYVANTGATLYAIWKLKYFVPTISNLKAIRCDADGNQDDFGTHAKVTFGWECSELIASNPVASVTVYYALVDSDTWTPVTVNTSGAKNENETVIIAAELSIESRYQFKVTVVDTLKYSDSGTTTSSVVIIPSATFAIDFLAGGTGVAIGKVAEIENAFDVGKTAVFRDDVLVEGYIGTNGHMYMTNGKILYSQNTNGADRSMVQTNASNEYFFGYGGYSNNEGTSYFDGNSVHIRSKGAIAFTSPTAGLTARQYGVNKVLWSGAKYMNGSHTITFSESVSAQPNGIMLVFDEYDSGSAKNQGFICRLIPKYLIAQHSGRFFQFTEPTWYGGDTIMIKGLYISNTGATGHACSEYTSNPYRGTSYVLKYVIGV